MASTVIHGVGGFGRFVIFRILARTDHRSRRSGRSGPLALEALQGYLTFVLRCGHETMTFTDKLMTSVSTKGQVILPKSIRQRRHWDVGTRLIVEDTPDGVLLRAAPIFRQTRPDEVFASLKVAGPPKTLEEMDAGVAAEARRRYARD